MASEEPSTSGTTKRKTNGRYCCVVNCHVNQKNKPEGTKFYSFPELCHKQKNLWIKAVNRINPDGSEWIPSKYSAICSNHFAGGRKSNKEDHPAFIPTIFSSVYHVKGRTQNDCNRYQRAERRNKEDEENLTREEQDKPEVDTDTVSDENLEVPTLEVIRTTYWDRHTQTHHKILLDVNTETEPFKPESFMNNLKTDKQFISWFGIPKGIFYVLLDLIKENMTRRTYKLTPEDRLAIVLVKLKSGLSFLAMTSMFHVDELTISRNFYSCLELLYEESKDLIIWPTRSEIDNRMPESFQRKYPQTRCILDATEVLIETPNLSAEKCLMLYSDYKNKMTLKWVIAIAPSGEVIHVSECYGGRATDSQITTEMGIIELLEPGDAVMADKGFPGIIEIVEHQGSFMIVPPTVREGRQFSPSENNRCYKVASVRIHVERTIRRIKYFKIMHSMPQYLAPVADKIMIVICLIVNLMKDLIKEN